MPDSPTPTSWRAFFDAHAPNYLRNPFTRYTLAEVNFLVELFGLVEGASILDMGCGTGRHAVELARRGYRVTGVDLSEGMLAQARSAVLAAGVEVELVQADATAWRRERAFDAAICLCEGGFGLIGPEDDAEVHDYRILENVSASLKAGAPFVLTGLNGYQIIRQMRDENVAQGSFDPATMIAHYRDDWDLPEGRREVNVRERLFIPPEVVAMLRRAGFEVRHVWGGTAGEWGERPVKLDEIEVMYVCRKR
ncbi:MAG: methyltransferase domain-containing protein [Fimbriimonadaceae bacterium]|nr:methyltransferase domain-containing protein [Fimbriimonadaceae bacterium]